MSRSKNDLHPATRMRVNAVIAAMGAYGYPLMIIRTYDTLKRQEKLYAQGRTTPGNIVTKIKKGWHNIRKNNKPCARAVDFAFKKQKRFPNRGPWDENWPWERLRKIGAACDLTKPLKWDLGHLVDKQDQTFRQAWEESDKT